VVAAELYEPRACHVAELVYDVLMSVVGFVGIDMGVLSDAQCAVLGGQVFCGVRVLFSVCLS